MGSDVCHLSFVCMCRLMSSSVVIENGRESTTGESALHQSSSSPAIFGQSQATTKGGHSQRPNSSSGGRKAGNAVFNQKKYVHTRPF